MEPIYDSLYQFTEMGGQMSLPVHQYLLATDPSIMIATGSYSQAEWILPQIADILGDKPLRYLFISHMESDEAGGVKLFIKKYPKLTIVCSSFTARELKGFGVKAKIIIGDENHGLIEGDLALKFFKYPAEVHLRDGILMAELNRGIFYSSDLMFHHVVNGSKVINVVWDKEVSSIDAVSIQDETRREKLKGELADLHPKFIAVGHGCCTAIE